VSEQTALELQGEKKLLAVLSRNKSVINSILPAGLDEKRFGWLVVNSIRTNPNLLNVTPASFLNCVVVASQMGLEIRKDQAYLVPFGKECQLLIDYKGKMDLARRSGKVGGIQAVTVRANDKFHWAYNGETGVEFSHEPDFFGDRGDIRGFYAFAQLPHQFIQFKEPMSLMDIDLVRKRSKKGVGHRDVRWCMSGEALSLGFNDKDRTPWTTDFEAMALKTVLHRLCKALPLSPEMQLSQDVDEALEAGNPTPNVIENLVDLTEEDHKPIAEVEAKTFAEWRGGVREQVAERRIEEISGKIAAAPEVPAWVEGKPRAATLSDIRKEEPRLTTARWAAILGESGFEDPKQIDTEGKAREILSRMRNA
jgi:recombination protein RecT